MWNFQQTTWMRDAAIPRVQRFKVQDPGSAIDIPEGHAVLWRYMDLAKLLALVSKHSLFFSALDKLGDRFEGRWSRRNLELIQDRHELWMYDRDDHVVLADRRRDQRLNFPKQDSGWSVDETIQHWNGVMRKGASLGSTFVNCWYEGAEESEAMWKLFASQQYGVAIRTTAARLIGSFTDRLPDYFGRVSYIPYDSQLIPVTDFPPVFFKRLAFEHEREVRAVAAPGRRVNEAKDESRPLGVEYPIDPEQLIEAVVVSPYSPDWLQDVIQSILAKYEINSTVERSALDQPPPGDGPTVSVRSPKAYFAFRERETPLRIWATSRANAIKAACERWQLDTADEHIDVWTEAECVDGYGERPEHYEQVVSHHNTEHQNSLDPERT